jgi:hypothetical protein
MRTGWRARISEGSMAAALLLLVPACDFEPRGPKPILDRVESALRARNYFTPAETKVADVIFYCVCGPYTNCEPESKELADKLDYKRPPHKFPGLREEQKILFFRSGEITEIYLPHARYEIAEPHQAYCSRDMNLQIPRRSADGKILGPPID